MLGGIEQCWSGLVSGIADRQRIDELQVRRTSFVVRQCWRVEERNVARRDQYVPVRSVTTAYTVQ